VPVVGTDTPDLVQQSELEGAGALRVGPAHGAPARALRVQAPMSAREYGGGSARIRTSLARGPP
jgi:hypothetical protein